MSQSATEDYIRAEVEGERERERGRERERERERERGQFRDNCPFLS